MAGAKLTLVSR